MKKKVGRTGGGKGRKLLGRRRFLFPASWENCGRVCLFRGGGEGGYRANKLKGGEGREMPKNKKLEPYNSKGSEMRPHSRTRVNTLQGKKKRNRKTEKLFSRTMQKSRQGIGKKCHSLPFERGSRDKREHSRGSEKQKNLVITKSQVKEGYYK